jgi:hypothetical protein
MARRGKGMTIAPNNKNRPSGYREARRTTIAVAIHRPL